MDEREKVPPASTHGRDAVDRPLAKYLEAYFDDSGSDERSPVYTIAGYCGMPANFATFGERWKKALDGPPRFPYWHTNTARNLKYHPRHGICREHVEPMELKLAEVLVGCSRFICAVSVEVRKSLFDEVVTQRLRPSYEKLGVPPRAADSLRSPFYIMFHHAVIVVAAIATQMGSELEGHHLFMEDAEGAEWQDEICHSVRAFRRLAPPKYRKAIAAVTFLPGKGRVTAPGLEAADLWASHVRRRALEPEETNGVRILLESVRGARENRIVLSSDELRSFVDAANAARKYEADVSADD